MIESMEHDGEWRVESMESMESMEHGAYCLSTYLAWSMEHIIGS